jgi:glycosyltransferase involved in cell wall biosynthesis
VKIAFLEGDMSRQGGTERMTAFLANALSGDNTVFVLSLQGDGISFFPMNNTVSCLPLPQKFQRSAIHKFLLENDIDVVINVDTGMAIFGVPAALGLKTRVITWEHSNYYNNWNSKWFPHIRRFAAKNSDALVVLTSRDRQNYKENIANCCPIVTISNPMERHDVNYSISSKTILSVGHISKLKRFDLIPEIGKIVFQKYPDWKWYICGDGSEKALLKEKITECGMQNNIALLGTIKDMEDMYRKASIYVMTSEMEGLPMVLLEAKSYGLPIISFDIMTGPAEIVRDGVNGYLVESGDAEAMAERICDLIGDASKRKSFAAASIIDSEKFNEEGIIERWEKLFASITK